MDSMVIEMIREMLRIRSFWWIVLFVIYLHRLGVHGDLCKDFDIEKLQDSLSMGKIPRGGPNAGQYWKDKKATDLASCTKSCCYNSSCNVAFLHKKACFLIACNKTVPNACDPIDTENDDFAGSMLIRLRTLDETKPVSDKGNADKSSQETEEELIQKGTEEPANDPGLTSTTSENPTTDSGVEQDGDGEKPKRPKDKSCLFGILGECQENEECFLNSNRKRLGVCVCVNGTKLNKETGWCEKITRNTGSTTTEATVDSKHHGQENVSKPQVDKNTSAPNTTTTTMPTTTLLPLVVSAGENKQIQLPENSVTLSAFVMPKPEKDEKYTYEWSLESGPKSDESGHMAGKNTANLKLSDLSAGTYVFSVKVSSPLKLGQGFVNVTVLPPKRKNKPPVAIIKPANQQVELPNTAVLDGSESTDDDKIIEYHWEEISGPLNSQDVNGDKPMLQLKDLKPGVYLFKLTVKDSDGVTNSTFANVTVKEETDYPPKANAGSDVILYMPKNSVILYGNQSTDDKAIVSYEWSKSTEEDHTADMTGVRTPFLHLSNLEVGDYTFTLKVSDAAGHTSTADVHVFVKPEENKPPTAHAGEDIIVELPGPAKATLNGNKSTDDQKVISFEWKQISGPDSIVLTNADKAVATVSGLKVGNYEFQLTVKDKSGLSSSDKVKVIVQENENQPPKAVAGGDQVITLPQSLFKIDGTKSSDDKAIVSYTWTRSDDSLSVGTVLNNSDHQAVLLLTGLVPGHYMFTLEVKDGEGKSDTDSASVFVKPDVNDEDLVEIYLDADIYTFKEKHKQALASQLALLLHKTSTSGDTTVKIQSLDVDRGSGKIIVIFYVENGAEHNHKVLHGTGVAAILKEKLYSESNVLDFQVTKVDTMVCQNNCSGHGHCDPFTKKCVCEAFWMENFIQALIKKESNCDWSILYVIIILFVVVITIAGILWGIVYCCRRCRTRPKRKHRYQLLNEFDKDGYEMKSKNGKILNGNVLVSESEITSDDEETLFINQKKQTKKLNGLIKPGRTKLRA